MSEFLEESNDDEIVGTILTRREALATAAKAGFGLVFAGATGVTTAHQAAEPKIHLVASPELEEGPFFVDENLNRSNLIAGTTRPSVIQGIRLSLAIEVHALKNGVISPLPGAHVDIWQCDALGAYSDISAPMNNEYTSHQSWLRGYQVADAKGKVRFETIFPGWYPARTTHIHVKIRSYSAQHNKTAEFTTQLFFDDKLADSIFEKGPYANRGARPVYNNSDGVYSVRQVDGTKAGDHMKLTLTQHPRIQGYSTSFAIALTTDNFNLSQRRRVGGPPGPPPWDDN